MVVGRNQLHFRSKSAASFSWHSCNTWNVHIAKEQQQQHQEDEEQRKRGRCARGRQREAAGVGGGHFPECAYGAAQVQGRGPLQRGAFMRSLVTQSLDLCVSCRCEDYDVTLVANRQLFVYIANFPAER